MPGTGMSVARFMALLLWVIVVKYALDLGAAFLAARMPNPFTAAIKAVIHA